MVVIFHWRLSSIQGSKCFLLVYCMDLIEPERCRPQYNMAMGNYNVDAQAKIPGLFLNLLCPWLCVHTYCTDVLSHMFLSDQSEHRIHPGDTTHTPHTTHYTSHTQSQILSSGSPTKNLDFLTHLTDPCPGHFNYLTIVITCKFIKSTSRRTLIGKNVKTHHLPYAIEKEIIHPCYFVQFDFNQTKGSIQLLQTTLPSKE